MARPVKEGPIRRAQILDAAAQLFAAKGYEATTVNDLILAVGLSKGAFYYHFASKEAVLDALIERTAQAGVAAAEQVAASELPVEQKLLAAIMAQRVGAARREAAADAAAEGAVGAGGAAGSGAGGQALLDALHAPNNALMHQKVLVMMTDLLTPPLARIVEQGMAEGLFSTPYPEPSVKLLLALAQLVFDDGFFKLEDAEAATMAAAYVTAAERVLGAQPGSLSGLLQTLGHDTQ